MDGCDRTWGGSGGLFDGQTKFSQHNVDLSKWDVSRVTNFDFCFQFNNAFNGDISSWNVANGEYFNQVFRDNHVFNRDISGWDVRKGRSFEAIFRNAYVFNQDVGKWRFEGMNYDSDTKRTGHPQSLQNSASLKQFFYGARAFNQKLDNWDVSRVSELSDMFMYANKFVWSSQDWSNWDTSKVKSMFRFMKNSLNNGAIAGHPGGLENWDVTNVETMKSMVEGNQYWNGDISKWVTSSLKDIENIFSRNARFNGDVSKWDVSKVEAGKMKNAFASTNSWNFRPAVEAAWSAAPACKLSLSSSRLVLVF